jgi:excinuclease ABC subunit C
LDAIALSQGHDEAWIEIFFVRQGNLVGRDHFIMQGTRDSSDAEVLGQFIQQFYDSASYIPRTVLLPAEPGDSPVLQQWLTGKRSGPVTLLKPQRGAKRRLAEMVAENASQGLEQLKIKWLSNDNLMQSAMSELEEQLSLPRTPRRIECYDISHIQGTNVVASMSVFVDGKPKPSDYRRFRMKHTQNNDDFASMREVLTRRFKRLSEAEQARRDGEAPDAGSFGETPDLVLIDGGKGQLSSALETMLQMGVLDVPLASLAKKEEEIFLPDSPEPVVLPRNSQALFLVQRARDEAHRFAVTYHRNLRSKSATQSALDLVPGVGPKRKRDLVRKFGSVKAIREASPDQLAATPGMTRRLAERIKEYLG